MKKPVSTKIITGNFEDQWSATKAKIEALAAEQTTADVALVEAERAYQLATKKKQEAIARKTIAEKKLAAFRANLGVD